MRGLLTAVLLFCLPSAALAQTGALSFGESPRLFVSFDIRGAVHVQQQIVIRILVVSGSPFESLMVTRPEAGPEFDVVELSAPRTRMVRTDAATGYAHEASYALFPLRSGDINLPSVRALGRVTDAAGQDVEFELARPGSALTVLAAPETWSEPWWMVSERVEIEEGWSVPPERVRQGEAIRRTITVTAHGVPADRIAAPEHPAMAGAVIVDAGIELRTAASPDGVIGTLTRRWDLLIGPELVLLVPPVRVASWDPVREEPSLRMAPSRRLEPGPPDVKERAAFLLTTAKEEQRDARLLLRLLLLVALAPVLGLIAALALVYLPSSADLRMAAACRRAKQPIAALRAVGAWERETGLAPEASDAVRRLEAEVFGCAGSGEPRAVAAALLRRARRARFAAFRAGCARLLDAVLGPEIDIPGGRRAR